MEREMKGKLGQKGREKRWREGKRDEQLQEKGVNKRVMYVLEENIFQAQFQQKACAIGLQSQQPLLVLGA